jgi:hypothetical protein
MMTKQDLQDLKDLEVAKRLRAEHALLRRISAELTAAIGQMPEQNRDAWSKAVKGQYEQFRAHMTKRIALEEVGGFMSAVEERRPTLAPQIEQTRREHRAILDHINAVYRELQDLDSEDTAGLQECLLKIQLILTEVQQHERKETLLVGFVFTQDIGAAD